MKMVNAQKNKDGNCNLEYVELFEFCNLKSNLNISL